MNQRLFKKDLQLPVEAIIEETVPAMIETIIGNMVPQLIETAVLKGQIEEEHSMPAKEITLDEFQVELIHTPCEVELNDYLRTAALKLIRDELKACVKELNQRLPLVFKVTLDQ